LISFIPVIKNKTLKSMFNRLFFCTPMFVTLALILFNELDIRYPGEWEPQESVWICFRTGNSGSMYDSVTIPVIRKLSEHVKTCILIENDTLLPEGLAFFAKQGIDTTRLQIICFPIPDFWYRDYGPIIVNNQNGKLYACDFKFTRYSNIPFRSVSKDIKEYNSVDMKLARLMGIPVKSSWLVIEGGAIETNGAGTLILVDSLILKRNPGATKMQIEKEFSRILGIKTFLWMKGGLFQDPYGSAYFDNLLWASGTGGHTDHFVRFANDSTVLLYWEYDTITFPDAVKRMNYIRMSENLKIIESATDHRGRKFKVVKIPSPGVIYRSRAINKDLLGAMSELPARFKTDSIKLIACCSYLNYLITNNLVIIPKYAYKASDIQNETDGIVKKIFTELYPGREIYQLNPLILNYGGGGLHCIYRPLQENKTHAQ
jgi:agmatine deiminase